MKRWCKYCLQITRDFFSFLEQGKRTARTDSPAFHGNIGLYRKPGHSGCVPLLLSVGQAGQALSFPKHFRRNINAWNLGNEMGPGEPAYFGKYLNTWQSSGLRNRERRALTRNLIWIAGSKNISRNIDHHMLKEWVISSACVTHLNGYPFGSRTWLSQNRLLFPKTQKNEIPLSFLSVLFLPLSHRGKKSWNGSLIRRRRFFPSPSNFLFPFPLRKRRIVRFPISARETFSIRIFLGTGTPSWKRQNKENLPLSALTAKQTNCLPSFRFLTQLTLFLGLDLWYK